MTLGAAIRETMTQRAAERAIDFVAHSASWGDLKQLANRIGAALKLAGVLPCEPVALIIRNDLASAALLAAMWSQDRQAVVLNGHSPGDRLASDAAGCGAVAVAGAPSDFAGALGVLVRERGLAAVTVEDDGAVRLLQRRGKSAPAQVSLVDGIDLGTSGTTGPPKRVRLSAATLLAAARSEEDSVLDGERDLPSHRQRVPFINFYPLANIAGIYFWAHACVSGRPTVLQAKFNVDEWLQAVRRYNPAVLYIPPAAVAMVLEAELPSNALHGALFLRSGNAPLPHATRQRFEQTFGIPILCHYGATEFCGVVTTWTRDDWKRFGERRHGSLGRARPGVTLRVVDPVAGSDLRVGQTGLLEVRAQRIGPEFLRTTDLACLDADGFLFIQGRADDAINRGGFKVSSDAVAEVLRRHPAVREAAVVGIEHAVLGQVPVAAVTMRDRDDAADEETLIAFARAHLAPFQVPTAIRVVESLPRTASLKVDRAGVRALFFKPQETHA